MRLLRAYAVLLKNIIKITVQLFYGVWKVAQLPHPIITVFGGARFPQDNRYASQAHELAHKLVESNISVITGGGPGIMQAASCGAYEDKRNRLKSRTLGITVKGINKEEPINKCVEDYIVLDYFFARKWLMSNYSIAFAVFPGGFGTLDELTEVLTLMQTKNLPGVPVVLIGKDYWQPFITWLHDYSFKNGLVSAADLAMLQTTDDLDQAVQFLIEQCEKCKHMFKE